MFKSRDEFFYFVKYCNDNYRSGHDLHYYREIIHMHRKYNNLERLLDDDDLYQMIYDTLEKWNMNQQGAKLKSLDEMKESILANKPLLFELYKHRLESIGSPIDETGEKVIRILGLVFKGLSIMKTKRRMVGVSKAMHFLLPDLVLPIDGKYSMTYFYGYNKYADNPESEAMTFKEIFNGSNEIARILKLTDKDIDGIKWNTSIPKLIDNAIIGFFKHVDGHGPEKTMELIKDLRRQV